MNIKRDNWFVKEDELLISLMHFHVRIRQIIKEEENIIYWQAAVTNSDMDVLYMGFVSLEEAIYFTENYISKAWDFEDLLEKKKEYRKEKKEKGKVKVKRLNNNRN